MFAQNCDFIAKNLARGTGPKTFQENEGSLENWPLVQTLCDKGLRQYNLLTLQVSSSDYDLQVVFDSEAPKRSL